MAKSRADSGRAHHAEHIGQEREYGFERLIDLAHAAPVTVEKHGRPVVVVLAIEEYERPCERANGAARRTALARRRRARLRGLRSRHEQR
ncbi:type II toxin-antitoxin system prevent-host-death family antitoxin [Bradyrhizobium sp. HKCCYLS1011]|uniref:type II toxin-antitoxin system prevent-host-death family antitoxin n=1 Tax=Bradyrhizobium sp. HKCCYLS1011 TaxID=3420733 RepID=UPI003EBEC06E